MPFYYIIIIILIIVVVISLILNLLTNPFVWIIIAGLVIWSWIRRYLYARQLEEYNKEFEKRTQQAKEYYYGSGQEKQYYHDDNSSNGDVIDVDYTVVDEENGDD